MSRVYLTCMGELYELSRTKYRQYLKAVAEGGSADLNQYGKRLAARVGNVTDITGEDARTLLDGGVVSWLPSPTA